MRALISLLVFSTTFFAVGCATMESGKPLDLGAASTFKEGVTTRQQIEAALGPAQSVTTSADGGAILVYTHIVSKGSAFNGATATATSLAYLFDRDGLLKQATRTQNTSSSKP